MKKQDFTIHRFRCTKCNNIIPLPRKSGRQRKKNHIKDIYCPVCNEVTKMKELND